MSIFEGGRGGGGGYWKARFCIWRNQLYSYSEIHKILRYGISVFQHHVPIWKQTKSSFCSFHQSSLAKDIVSVKFLQEFSDLRVFKSSTKTSSESLKILDGFICILNRILSKCKSVGFFENHRLVFFLNMGSIFVKQFNIF